MSHRDNIERVALILAFIVAGTALFKLASESQWKKFTSEQGAFTILMPGKPSFAEDRGGFALTGSMRAELTRA